MATLTLKLKVKKVIQNCFGKNYLERFHKKKKVFFIPKMPLVK